MAVPLSRRDGAYFGTLCALDPLPAELSEDQIVAMELLSSLISYELEAEELRERQAAALLDAQEAARFREQLVATVGHDLRTPITAIGLAAQLLQSDPALTDDQRELADSVRASAARAGRLIEQVLDFTRARLSREIPLNRKRSDLGRTVEEIINELRRVHPASTFDLRLKGDLTGEWDADRLGRVVANLANNAVAYGASNRPIAIAVEGCDGDAVRIEVRNEGNPISPENIERIFEPFQRASDASGGIGLGLYIIKRIVDAHHGTIGVESSEQSGTVFGIVLPRAASDKSTHS